MAPGLRAAPWGAVLGGSAAGALLLLLAAAAPQVGTALVPLAVALLAGAGAFVLDEPAADAVDATPTSLRRRTAARALVALVPLGVGVLALLVLGRRVPEVDATGVAMLLAGCLLVAVALASGLRRRLSTPGEAASATVGLSVIALAFFEPLSRWVVLLPTTSDAAWDRTATLWSAAAVVSAGAIAWTTRDRLSRRESGRRRAR